MSLPVSFVADGEKVYDLPSLIVSSFSSPFFLSTSLRLLSWSRVRTSASWCAFSSRVVTPSPPFASPFIGVIVISSVESPMLSKVAMWVRMRLPAGLCAGLGIGLGAG